MAITKFLKIAIGLILGIFLIFFVVGMMLPNSEPADTTAKVTGTFPTETDTQWMQSTRENSDMFLQNANEINGIMNGTQEMNPQRLIFCSGEVTNWARSAQEQSEKTDVSPELKEAKAEYAKATGEYATMGDYINDGVLAVQRGNMEDGEKFLGTGMEHYNTAEIHYNNYLNLINSYEAGN